VSSEVQWARAARDGDRDAFAALYRRFAPTVHGVLVSLVRPAEATDLVHEVFLHALRSIERLDDPARFGAWVCTIARNLARDQHKGRREAAELPEELPARERSEPDGDAEEAERALAALRSLPEAYRETLALRLVEGMNGPEIAERTGMTPGSVRVNLCRGMKLLREHLQRKEVG
jgi:RNA polymerase sigma-70 factor (ECF subfamily)